MAITSVTDQVRVLIADYQTSPQKFTDDEIQLFLDLSDDSIFLAAALACDQLAAGVAANLQEVRIGDYMNSSGKNQASVYQAQAAAYRDLEYNTPAFAVVEENNSDFNALIIIRNYVLRTSP